MGRGGVTTGAKPHGQQQHARDLEVERAVMGQRCRPQSFGEVQRCYPLFFVGHPLPISLSGNLRNGFGIITTIKNVSVLIRTTSYQLVCTWYEPDPKIRICRYLCTRAASPPKKEQKAY